MIQNFYTQFGVPSQYSDQMKMIMEFLTPEKVMLFLPGCLVLGAFFAAFINYNVTRIILRKLKYEVNSLTPLEKIYLDNRIGALLIIIFCVGIILNGRGFSLGTYIYISALIILLCAFVLDGIALSAYYLNNKFKLSKGFIILIIVLAMLYQLIIVFLYLGIADMIFDFRKLDPNRMLRKKSK